MRRLKISRYIPQPVRRQLRQEAFFGCAQCGCPILDYHHIIPWEERHHNEVEHMIALCPTHHRDIAKRRRSYAYDLKENPYNKTSNNVNGLLATDFSEPIFELGTNTYIATPIIFSYYHVPIFKYEVEEGQTLLTVFIPKNDFWPEIEIVKNEYRSTAADFWDIEFRTNYLKIKKDDKSKFFEIDLRKGPAKVSANFEINGQKFSFSPTSTSLGGVTMQNCTFSNCAGGIAVGNGRQRLLRPNYAMAHPSVKFTN